MLGIIIAAVAVGVGSLGVYKTVTEPELLYPQSGSLENCPDRPSCVSSLAAVGSDFHVAALPEATQEQIHKSVVALGGEVKSEQEGYLHAVFVTPRMKFHDDLEVLHDGSQWQVRSVSRFGYRDFGVNRQRVETLRQELSRRE